MLLIAVHYHLIFLAKERVFHAVSFFKQGIFEFKLPCQSTYGYWFVQKKRNMAKPT